MQHNFRSHSQFSQRTEDLASQLALSLGELPAKIGISERMFYGYRSGKYPITDKAWRKLEALEESTRGENHSFRSEPQSDASQQQPPEMVTSAQHFAAGVQSMLTEIQEMRKRIQYLEDIVRKGPEP